MKITEFTLRQRKILHMIENQDSYVTSRSLAQALQVSSRTIRNDIHEMNEALFPYKAAIISTNSKGFLFQAEDPDTIKALTRIDMAVFTREERIRYLAVRLCETEEPLNLYDLEDEVFASRTALISDLQVLKKRYTYDPPFIRMIRKGDEFRFEQDELKIRSVLLHLFHEDWDYTENRNAFFGYQFIDKELLELLVKKTPAVLYHFGVCMEDTSLTALILTIAIMHHRFTNNHVFPGKLLFSDMNTPVYEVVQHLFALLEDKTGIQYPDAEKARIYQFIDNTRLPGDIPNKENEEISGEVLQEAGRYLEEIRNVFGVDFSKDSEFVYSLRLFFQKLWKNSLIFYQHQDLLEIKRTLTAEYELAWLFQRFAPNFIDRFLCENELSNLVFCFSGAIRHYLYVHPEKKLNAVLFSHRDMVTAWALKRRIMESYSLYLNISEILPLNYFEQTDISSFDLAFTTLNVEGSDREKDSYRSDKTDVIVLDDHPTSNFGKCEEQIKLLSFKNIWPVPSCTLRDLLNNAYWTENSEYANCYQIIEKMADDYIRTGTATQEHAIDIATRETRTSFASQQGLVFLHTAIPALETRLAVMTLKHRVRWNDFRISTVVMAMFRKEDINLLFHLKIRFCNHSYNEEALKS